VVQEAMAQKISEERQREGFEPSVPFVACFSACMEMAETVAQICGWPSILEPRFQFDFLRGPAYGQELPQTRRTDCICARRKNIDKLREARIALTRGKLLKSLEFKAPQTSLVESSDEKANDSLTEPVD